MSYRGTLHDSDYALVGIKINEEISTHESWKRLGNAGDFYKKKRETPKKWLSSEIDEDKRQGRTLLLSDKECIANRWKEYFHELINRPGTAD